MVNLMEIRTMWGETFRIIVSCVYNVYNMIWNDMPLGSLLLNFARF